MVELYKHNAETYNKAVEVLDKYNKVLIVQAPSTGKSFIIMKLLQEKYADSSILFVVPTYSIRLNIESYKEWDGENVTFMSYSYLSSIHYEDELPAYDVVVFDEVHHAGAAQWGKPLKFALYYGITCIGLTATSVRGSDGVDISKEFFFDCTVYGMDIKTAIESNTLSQFKYHLVLGDITKELKEAENKMQTLQWTKTTEAFREQYQGLNLSDISNYEMSNLVQQSLNPGVNKWLVFCSRKSEMEDIDQDIHEWFGCFDLPILKIDSTCTRKFIKESLNTFNEYTGDKPIVLVSINILNEGLHVDGVTGVIFLRRTKSLAIFIQQCGRGLTTNKDVTPVFIDAVENISALRKGHGTERDSKPSTVKATTPALAQITDILSIKDTELLDVVDFIESVNSYDENTELSDTEKLILQRYYPYIAGRINKPKAVIMKTAKEMGLIQNKYTIEIDAKIRELYPKEGSKMAAVVGLTKEEVRYRASKLGVKYLNRWTLEDDTEVLLGHVPEGRTEEECKERLELLKRRLV